MSRNKDRLGAHQPPPAEAPPQMAQKAFDPLSFVAPTEFVELPSGGCYPEHHPLHGKDVLEIRYMTAKEEDILSSETLLRKGLAIERMLDSLIIDKNIKAHSLLVGDRNALIIAARISGYGSNYLTQVVCPACTTRDQFTFDLNEKKIHQSSEDEGLDLKKLSNGNFSTKVPFSGFQIEFRNLDGKDEQYLTKNAADRKKRKLSENALTEQFKVMIVSIEGHSDPSVIRRYVDSMPTIDSRHLRACYKIAAPDVKVKNNFECSSCGHQQELEVPFNTDFFWPDR